MYLKQKRIQQARIQANAQSNTDRGQDRGQDRRQDRRQDINQTMNTFEDFSDNIDLDSYIDPAIEFSRKDRLENENDVNVIGYSNDRLDKNDIMARDLADG